MINKWLIKRLRKYIRNGNEIGPKKSGFKNKIQLSKKMTAAIETTVKIRYDQLHKNKIVNKRTKYIKGKLQLTQ